MGSSFLCPLLLTASISASIVTSQTDVTPAYELLYRNLKVRVPFSLQLESACPGFCVYAEHSNVLIKARSFSDLTAGIGYYLKYSNITIGWRYGGGSHVKIPDHWPDLVVQKQRSVPYSSFLNVCTHSYSLVWYNEADWSALIDWLALSGINNILALTGQEYIQWLVFPQLGVQDEDIRCWFNGPAFLTWSRGQNEYGSNIAGPLPMSWMVAQYKLQKDFILARLRSLGIIGQLPGFQGNVPIQLKDIFADANITKAGATGWMDSLDPLYSEVAILWMETLLEHFGTDHWYQLDGYFNGGTAPWIASDGRPTTTVEPTVSAGSQNDWSFNMDIPHDDAWYRRGVAAYNGLNHTDPDAVWSFQGFSFVHWDTQEEASYLKGFIDSTKRFVIVDMSYGYGQWTQWKNSSFFGSEFIWTKLHNFGGTDGLKGNLYYVNQMPFDAKGRVIGIGATPEGISQNPIYYEILFSQAFRDAPVTNLTAHIIHMQHQRYGLASFSVNIAKAWALLMNSAYASDGNVQDMTGVGHIVPRGGAWGGWGQGVLL